MKRKATGAALAFLVGVACSGCGSTRAVSLTHLAAAHPATPAVHQLPFTRIGTGSATLGTFAVHGNVRIRATCTGPGKFEVKFAQRNGSDGIGGVRCQGDDTLAMNVGSNVGQRGGGPALITIHAPKHMKWWLDAVDRQPKI
jgi:hypothetical protein